MSKRTPRPALLVRVLTEIGKGNIHESFIVAEEGPQVRLDGYQEGPHIWVNPMWNVVDTVIHEALHRLEPKWNENYVRNRTTFLMRRMSDEQVQALYESYQAIVKRRRKRGARAKGTPGSDSGASQPRFADEVRDGASGARREPVGEAGTTGRSNQGSD